MGESIIHILSPLSAPWCGWTMLVLLLCAVLSEYMQPGAISQAHSSLFSKSDRTYKDAPISLMGQIMLTLFRIGTLAMSICLCVYTEGSLGFGAFAAIGGITLAVLLLKMACTALLDYTFQFTRRFAPAYEPYSDIATLAICILYPAILAVLYIGNMMVARWVFIGATALFILMWTYRMMRTYLQSPLAILYIALYIVTLEVLPIGVLFYLSSKTILYI